MKVKQHSITVTFEDKEVRAISEISDLLDDLRTIMIDGNVNAVFDEDGFLFSRDNIEELKDLFDRLWNSPTVELCYSDHVEELDKNR